MGCLLYRGVGAVCCTGVFIVLSCLLYWGVCCVELFVVWGCSLYKDSVGWRLFPHGFTV